MTSSIQNPLASLKTIFLMHKALEAGWRLAGAVEGFCDAVEGLEVRSPLDPPEDKADHPLWADIPWG